MSTLPPVPVLNRANQIGTAAELLHYSQYTKKGTSEIGWTRWASANEKFEVAEKGGKKFLIEFDKNFSKKHLATFSKKEKNTSDKVAEIGKANPTNTPEQNLLAAQKILLEAKILDVLGIRGTNKASGPCLTCGHPEKDLPGTNNTGHSGSGNCKVPLCTCSTKYKGVIAYAAGREAQGKSDLNPLAGAATKKSTVLILNWIPLMEFQQVVADSILKADPKGEVPIGTEAHLKWDFGLGRVGAIRYAENGAIVPTPERTWVEVSAKKAVNATPFTSTWQVFHWHADG